MKRKADDEAGEPGMRMWNGHMVPADCDFTRLKLAVENSTPRDGRIVFQNEGHRYYIDGECDYTSVTTVIHEHFPAFDAEPTARKMVRKKEFRNGAVRYLKYQKMRFNDDGEEVNEDELVTSVVLSWTDYGAEMSALGTKMHNDIELFYNLMPVDNQSVEYGFFLQYEADMRRQGFTPFRTEITVYGEDEKICGSVDMLFKDGQGRYRLRDWKRSKEIRRHGFGKFGKGELRHLPDCNYAHYTLQMNLYKYLLEKYYDIPVYDMGLVVFHPDNASYVEIEARSTPDDIQALVRAHKRKHGV
jgi:ATP-dependent exoDNAse (exonuclease V) beta subunit